jgi:ribonuclease BN (tRNA processing enzyme)
MSRTTIVRINGRGNAWPVFLGGSSNFYKSSSEDLANASFSLLHYNGEVKASEKPYWEVLIDVGHHTVPFLIQNGNRLPDAVVLTHGHLDHTLGLDWVAQSVFHLSNKKKKLKVYCSFLVWNFVVQSYPHLKSIISFEELFPGQCVEIEEAEGLKLTAYPVFHGEYARGASMLFFEDVNQKSVLFTGDMLCPLLRAQDYQKISLASTAFIDANNRFPYPGSNHGSVVNYSGDSRSLNPFLVQWLQKVDLKYLISPHLGKEDNSAYKSYFDEFMGDYQDASQLSYSVFDFAELTKIKNIHLIHYGGMEDAKYQHEEVMSEGDFKSWVQSEAIACRLTGTKFNIPKTGEFFILT